jgi:hypothetical protein
MRAERSRPISGGHPPHQLARPNETAPVFGEKRGGILGERREMPVRDVRLAADHIQFVAAVQFCFLS